MTQRELRAQRRAAKQCIDCGEPASRGDLCTRHRILRYAACARWRKGHRSYFAKQNKLYRKGHGRAMWREQKKRYYRKSRKGDYSSYLRWSDQDERLVTASPLTDTELAAKIGRSVAAIQAKRCLLHAKETSP